jgi:hypothetical protein
LHNACGACVRACANISFLCLYAATGLNFTGTGALFVQDAPISVTLTQYGGTGRWC